MEVYFSDKIESKSSKRRKIDFCKAELSKEKEVLLSPSTAFFAPHAPKKIIYHDLNEKLKDK